MAKMIHDSDVDLQPILSRRIAVIGYGCGCAGRRRAVMTDALTLLIGWSLWITVDLDQPRSGLLRLSDAPLTELHRDIQREHAPSPAAP